MITAIINVVKNWNSKNLSDFTEYKISVKTAGNISSNNTVLKKIMTETITKNKSHQGNKYTPKTQATKKINLVVFVIFYFLKNAFNTINKITANAT